MLKKITVKDVLINDLWNIAIQPAVGCYNSWANFAVFNLLTARGKIFVKWDYCLNIIAIFICITYTCNYQGIQVVMTDIKGTNMWL